MCSYEFLNISVFKVSNDVCYACLITRRDVFAKQYTLDATTRMSCG